MIERNYYDGHVFYWLLNQDLFAKKSIKTINLGYYYDLRTDIKFIEFDFDPYIKIIKTEVSLYEDLIVTYREPYWFEMLFMQINKLKHIYYMNRMYKKNKKNKNSAII